MPDKPEDEIRIDDLPITDPAVSAIAKHLPCSIGRELLPFVRRIKEQAARPWGAPPLSSILLACLYMAAIHISDIEAAINFWRERKPSAGGVGLASEVRALAQLYGDMVFWRQHEIDERDLAPAAQAAWTAWYESTADTPCIAIC